MNRSKLILLACPALLAPILLIANPAHANEAVAQPTDTSSSAPTKPMFEVVFEQKTPESPTLELTDEQANAAIEPSNCNCSSDPMLEFTDKESNDAIARYGCDCSGCLNALRQLQGQLPPL